MDGQARLGRFLTPTFLPATVGNRPVRLRLSALTASELFIFIFHVFHVFGFDFNLINPVTGAQSLAHLLTYP